MKKWIALVLVLVISLSLCACGSSSSDDSGRECAQAGCDRKAVTSGDSVYCAQHSNRCGECGCYIDGDAMFCMDCLRSALG